MGAEGRWGERRGVTDVPGMVPDGKGTADGGDVKVLAKSESQLPSTVDLSDARVRRASPCTPSEDELAGILSTTNRVLLESKCTQAAARVLRTVAEVLGLNGGHVVTSLVFLLVFYERQENSHRTQSPQTVIPSCIYLASKIEERPTRVSDIVNVLQRVLHPLARDEGVLHTERSMLRHSAEDVDLISLDLDDVSRLDAHTTAAYGIGVPNPLVSRPGKKLKVAGNEVVPVDEPKVRTAATVATGLTAKEEILETANVEQIAKVNDEPSATTQSDLPGVPDDLVSQKFEFMKHAIELLRKQGLKPRSARINAEQRWVKSQERATEERQEVKQEVKQEVLEQVKMEVVKPEASDAHDEPRTEGIPGGTTTTTTTVPAESAVESLTTTSPPIHDKDDPNYKLSRPVVGELYYKQKAQILETEQLLLHALDSYVNVLNPFRVLMNLCGTLDTPKHVFQLAFTLLTDLLFDTHLSRTKLALRLYNGGVIENETDEDEELITGVPPTFLVDSQNDLVLDVHDKTPLSIAGDASCAAIRVAAHVCGVTLVKSHDKTRWIELNKMSDGWTRLDYVSGEPIINPGSGSINSSSGGTTNPLLKERTQWWWVAMGFDHDAVEFIARDILDAARRANESSE